MREKASMTANPPPYWEFEPSCRSNRGENFGSARHIGFHVFHIFGWLQRDSARVEGDRLPNQHDRTCVFFLGSVIFQDDEFGRLLAPARHAEQRPHAQPLHVVLFENLDRDLFGLGDGLRFIGHHSRSQDVGGVVAEVSDKDGGFRRGHTAPDPLGNLPQLTVLRDEYRHLRDGMIRAGLASIDGELITAQDGSFDHRLRDLEG